MNRALARIHALRTAQGAGERGSMSVEAILIVPAFLLIFFGVVQGVISLQANNVASAAATVAYNSARLYDATTADGVTAGNTSLTQAGTILSGTQVTVQRTAQTVTVTVSGTAATVIPGVTSHIERTVSGPTERWVQ